jgi:hypothetical protein
MVKNQWGTGGLHKIGKGKIVQINDTLMHKQEDCLYAGDTGQNFNRVDN